MSGLTLIPALLTLALSPHPDLAIRDDPSILDMRVVQIDPAHSVLSFSVKHFGFTRVRGQFREWGGNILWNPEDITQSSFTIVVKTGTVDTGLDRRDNDLKSDQFFDAENYPAIVFRSTRIEKKGEGFIAYGDLTIRDVTKEVAIPFEFLGTREFAPGFGRIFASGSLTIGREEFGLTNATDRVARSLSVVSDEVDLEIEIQGAALDPVVLAFDSREKPSIAETLSEVVAEADGFAAVEKFHALKESDPEGYNFSRNELIKLSYRLRDQGRSADAIAIAELAVQAGEEPSRNAHFTLALAYLASGAKAEALEQCRRMLELDEYDALALEALRQLKAS